MRKFVLLLVTCMSLGFAVQASHPDMRTIIDGEEFNMNESYALIYPAENGEFNYTLVFGDLGPDFCTDMVMSDKVVRATFTAGSDPVGKFTMRPLFEDRSDDYMSMGRGLLIIDGYDGEVLTGTFLTDRRSTVDYLYGKFSAQVCHLQ